MSAISLRLPESLHETARELAREENISINQLIATALAEKVSALKTVEHLRERGALVSRSDFDAALAGVQAVEPDPQDAFPAPAPNKEFKLSHIR